MKRKAIGYIQLEISGSRVEADRRAIERYAAAQGLELVHILRMPATVIDNTLKLLDAAHRAEAEIVIGPTFDHVDSAKRAIAEQFEMRVADTGAVWPLGHRWPSQIMPEGVMSNGGFMWSGP